MTLTIVGATMRNADSLVKQLASAFETWATEDINDAYWDDQFRDMGLWDYERETRRKNGQIVYSPRDIYDTGRLYDSGRESFSVSSTTTKTEANWTWDAVGSNGYHYATDVHEGEGSCYGFPRPWTDDLASPQKFENSPPELALMRRVSAALNKQ